MRSLYTPPAVLGLALLVAACTQPAPSPAEHAAEARVEQAPPAPTPQAPPEASTAQRQATRVDSPGRAAQGAGVTKAAAQRFKSWGAVHAFLGAPVVAGSVISATEAIALTKDNHVGVTVDGGDTWSFVRLVTGKALSVAGTPGGPYVVSGKAGYVALSRDGKMWDDVARHVEDDLVSVAVSPSTIVAVGKRGTAVRYDTAGTGGFLKLLPDKFKAKKIMMYGGRFLAVKGKKGYATLDGLTWTPVPELPPLPGGKKVATTKGMCSMGKVGKSKGVVCEVAGVAFGLGANKAMVESKGVAATTMDGGNTWAMAALPFKGATAVVGNDGGPYFALGPKGGLAVTRDGSSWMQVPLNATKTLRAGRVDGAIITLVGDGGTIVRSVNGGESWLVLPPVGGSLKQLATVGGKLVASDGRKAIESADGGATWLDAADPAIMDSLPAIARPGACEARLPVPGEVCKFKRQVTTPLGLPKVRAFTFNGDFGLAMGDYGLVAFSTNGGASWKAKSGFQLKGLQDFNVKGDRIVGIGKSTIVVSTDAGRTFFQAQLPKKIGRIFASLIASDGAVYAVGAKGTILKAEGNLTDWRLLPTYPKNRTKYVAMYEVNGVLYATGAKGGIDRSQNKGAVWLPLASGVRAPILSMTGEANTVLAVAAGGRGQSNLLLRSNDGGLHFFVQREVSHSGRVHEFSLTGGVLTYNGRVSDDFGATWTPSRANYWNNAIALGDGSGLRIANYNRYRGKSEFIVIGPDKDDWTIVDSFYNNDAVFRCDAATGCWMAVRGQIYRPN